MAKLVWNQQDEQDYSYGIDRGVLYPSDGDGVAWVGLTSVSESHNGPELSEVYFDGNKVSETKAPRDFKATLQAYNCPPEFGPCEGEYRVIPGFIVTGQPRKTFDLSYRTRNGRLDGYQLHMIWNAMATKSQVGYVSINTSVSLATLEWKIDAVPPQPAGNYRPTAHFVVDSRKYTPDTMAILEEVLYGTISEPATLPSQADIIDILDVVDGGIPLTSYFGTLDGGSFETVGSGLVDGGENNA